MSSVSNILLDKEILLESGTNEVELLVFDVGCHTFGINVAKVREVLRASQITILPQAHSSIRGVFKLRNNVIPCVSLHDHLGIAAEGENSESTMILSDFNQQQTAFLVDEVERIHRISWEDILPVPQLDTLALSSITALARFEKRLILMLDFEQIFDEVTDQYFRTDAVDNPLGLAREELRILLVEDSATVREAIGNTLHQSGYQQVIFHENGAQAWQWCLDQLQQHQSVDEFCDLVICDVEMPRMDGLHLTRRIKEHSTLRQLPVLLYSSIITPDNYKKGQAVGADAQVSKPELAKVVHLADELIYSARQHRRAAAVEQATREPQAADAAPAGASPAPSLPASPSPASATLPAQSPQSTMRLPPEQAATEQAAPEQAPPEQAATEQAPPEQAATEQAATEQAPPEQAAPEQAAPEQAAPEQAATEQAATEQAAPEQAPPEQAAPEQAAPEQAPPEQAPPEQAPPEQAATEQAATEQAATEQAATEQAATEQAATEQAPPEQAAPEQAAPEQAAPEQAPPEQAPPEQAPPEQAPPEQATTGPSSEPATEPAPQADGQSWQETDSDRPDARLRRTFLRELEGRVRDLRELLDLTHGGEHGEEVHRQAARILHTIKSAAMVVPLDEITHCTHAAEGLLVAAQQDASRWPQEALEQYTDWLARLVEAPEEMGERLAEGEQLAEQWRSCTTTA